MGRTEIVRQHPGKHADLDEARDSGAAEKRRVSVPCWDSHTPNTHTIPMLMAMPTPIFSFFPMVRPQINCHGSRARATSQQAE